MKQIMVFILSAFVIVAIGWAGWQNYQKDKVGAPTGNGQAQAREILLYYYNPANDKDESGNTMCSPAGLVAVGRQITASQTPVQGAINLLMKGELSEEEIAAGVATEFPLEGLELKGANLNDGVLTLEFADPRNKTSGGSCRAGILRAQIEATAKQFAGVDEVRVIPEELFQP